MSYGYQAFSGTNLTELDQGTTLSRIVHWEYVQGPTDGSVIVPEFSESRGTISVSTIDLPSYTSYEITWNESNKELKWVLDDDHHQGDMVIILVMYG